MIFRVKDNKLYLVPNKKNEKAYLKRVNNEFNTYIQLDFTQLPPNSVFFKVSDEETEYPVKNNDGEILFYIEADEERNEKRDREVKKENIISQYKQKMAELTKDYTEEEQKTWGTQVTEAQAYLADNTTPTPMLTEIANGGDIGVLAQKIVEKANFLKIESGKLLAWKNRELAEIG